SGSGKTTTGRMLLRLLQPTSGEILIDGQDILKATPEALRKFRRQAQMIFQDPMAALNPRMKIGDAIKDALDIHHIGAEGKRRQEVLHMLDRVGLNPPETFYE